MGPTEVRTTQHSTRQISYHYYSELTAHSTVVQTDHRTPRPCHDWSSAARVAHQYHRSWGGEVLTPWKYVERVRVCVDPPLKMSHSFIQNCCCITASFTTSRMNSWTLSLHSSCLCWRCYHPYVWSAPSSQCHPINTIPLLLHWA